MIPRRCKPNIKQLRALIDTDSPRVLNILADMYPLGYFSDGLIIVKMKPREVSGLRDEVPAAGPGTFARQFNDMLTERQHAMQYVGAWKSWDVFHHLGSSVPYAVRSDHVDAIASRWDVTRVTSSPRTNTGHVRFYAKDDLVGVSLAIHPRSFDDCFYSWFITETFRASTSK